MEQKPQVISPDAARKSENGAKPKKKPYNTPKIEVYGKLQDITKAVGNKGALDNAGSGSAQRTHN